MARTIGRTRESVQTAAEGGSSAPRRLRAAVLLCGSVGANRLRATIGGTILDLPVEDGGVTVGSCWTREMSELADRLARTLDVRIVVDQTSSTPQVPQAQGRVQFSVERDPKDYRGTGGVLRDLAEEYEDSDCLLVANGAQLLLEPLTDQFEVLAESGGDVSLVSHRDGTPGGLMLVRCGALRAISKTGFVDMKEQALPQIAQSHDVRVVDRDRPGGLPLRTLADTIHALRMHHLKLDNRPAVADPYDENLSSTFSVVDESAKVHPSARLHDSVVMAGARVMPGAVVVRSLVGPGGVVARDRRVIDSLISSSAAAREQEVSA